MDRIGPVPDYAVAGLCRILFFDGYIERGFLRMVFLIRWIFPG